MEPYRNYKESDFARILASEFSTFGFNLTQKMMHKKRATEKEYRNEYILWALRRFGDVEIARKFLEYALPDMFDPVCEINGLRQSELLALDKIAMTERVRTDVRNLANEAKIDIEKAWDKLELIMPDLKQYRPTTDEDKAIWFNN